MSNFFESSAFLGVAVSLLSYALGSFLKKKFKTGLRTCENRTTALRERKKRHQGGKKATRSG